MTNEVFCKSILLIMRSAYSGVGSATPVNENEWNGEDDEAGIKDYIITLLRNEKKKAYMHGYAQGAINTMHEIKDLKDLSDGVFDLSTNRIGAEREFLRWEERNG